MNISENRDLERQKDKERQPSTPSVPSVPDTSKTEENRNEDEDGEEEIGISKNIEAINPKHYQLAEAGLWWDSFEEDPQFDICNSLDDLTLSEGGESVDTYSEH